MRRKKYFSIFSVFVSLLVATESNGQSIIVKFRAESAIAFPGIQLQEVSQRYFAKPLQAVPRFYTPNMGGQIPQSVSSFGLERIFVVPLREGMASSAAAEALASLTEVEWAEPNYILQIDAVEAPNDSLFAGQYAHRLMQVQNAWQTTKGDSAIKIGFVDTGAEWFHPDLLGQFAVNGKEDINGNGLFDAWSYFIKQKDARGVLIGGDLDDIDNDGNGYADDVIGYDFVDQEFMNFGDVSVRDPIPNDEHGHGTSVAGVIGARESNQIGVAGIAPGCRLVALRAFDATGNAEDDDIASAILYAADNGVKILNLSFGDIVPSLLQRDAIRYAESKGCLVFASSGNRGGSGRHYPSDFDECVSVGATGPDDLFYSFTTTGEGMDIVAPGADITTTTTDGGYISVSGTSFSAPAAAAVAGLVLSKNPKLSPREARSILAATTDDLFPYGYDHDHANGRINARAAMEFAGSASMKMTSPSTNEGFLIGDTIEIRGSAVSTFFTDYSLSFTNGLNPDINTNDESLWTPIRQSNEQVVLGTIGAWNTTGLAPGAYTLRLAVHSTNATTTPLRSTEERITIELKNSAPTIVSASLDTIFIGEKTGLLAQAEADTLTYASLYYREGGDANWMSKNDDRYTRAHAILLTTEDAKANTQYEMLYVLRNSRGDTSSRAFTAFMPDRAVPERGFAQKSYALPAGFILDTAIALRQGPTVIESIFPPGADFGPANAYSFDAAQKRFKKADSTTASWVPRSVGSTDGASRDLLLSGGNTFIVYRSGNQSVFGSVALEDTSGQLALRPLGFADPNGDGKDEIIALHQVTRDRRLLDLIELRSAQSADLPLIAELPNPTSPAPQFRDNRYQKPDVRAQDLNGDGADEIVMLDDDADLLVYSRDMSGSYKLIAIDSNNGFTEGTMVTIGDFDGDGKQDIVYAYHTAFEENALGEYDPKYWTVKTLLGNGDGSFSPSPPLKFWYARAESPYRSSLGVMNNVSGSGSTTLALSLFPDFYLFEFDTPAGRMMPRWHFPVSITPRTGLAYDFDGNGRREFAIDLGDSTYFFEREYPLPDRTPAPSALEAIPRDTNRVDLRWGAAPGATLYYILRAGESDDSLTVIDSTTSLTFSDTSVTNFATYMYSVIAVDSSRANPWSEPALAVDAFVHPKPRVTEIASQRDFLRVKVSEPLRTDALEGAGFLVDGLPCLSASVASDSFIVLRTGAGELAEGEHELRIHTNRLRDVYNSPLDTGLAGTWQHTSEEPPRRFYIVKWRFEDSRRIAVEFNARPADNALDVSRYTLSPYGTLVLAYRDEANPNGIFIDLANTQIVALGVPFVLCVRDITDEFDTPLEETEGNCAGITLIEPDLTHIMAYPNPAHSGDQKLTFARLTAEAEVSIYTASSRFLRRLRTTDRSGGLEWDLRDETGNLLPSGLYIYHVTGKDENGNDAEPNEAKFVIIRDK